MSHLGLAAPLPLPAGIGWILPGANLDIHPASTSAKRLGGYMQSTMKADLPLVMNRDYLELWRAGSFPPLQALTEWQQVAAIGEQLPSYQPFFWALLLLLPDFVFEQAQKDFIDLAGKILEQEMSNGL